MTSHPSTLEVLSSPSTSTACLPDQTPPGPVPAPAPRDAGDIPDPPLSAASSSGDTETKRTPYNIITDRIIALLEAGVVPWRASWVRQQGHRPQSFVTRKPYRGINHILLAVIGNVEGYSSPYWLTYRQATELGGHVRKGQKGYPCFFWKIYDGKNASSEDEAISTAKDSRKRFVARYYTVFSLDQCEGIELPPPAEPPRSTFSPIRECDRIVKGYHGPLVDLGNFDPCYLPGRDHVRMPAQQWFDSDEAYYATLFHELGHSTGHPSRLGRFDERTAHPFDSSDYSKEELVAEMTAAFLCAEAGISTGSIDNQAAYVASWLKALKNDSRMIVTAAAQAEKAADLILGRPAETQRGTLEA
jgi:antirestriction protein ArdC